MRYAKCVSSMLQDLEPRWNMHLCESHNWSGGDDNIAPPCRDPDLFYLSSGNYVSLPTVFLTMVKDMAPHLQGLCTDGNLTSTRSSSRTRQVAECLTSTRNSSRTEQVAPWLPHCPAISDMNAISTTSHISNHPSPLLCTSKQP